MASLRIIGEWMSVAAGGLSGTTLWVLAALALGAIVVGRNWDRLVRPGADFEIRYHPGRPSTTVRGRLPASKVGTLRSFFERDLRPPGPVAIRGTWGPPPSRVLSLTIHGSLDDRQRQRVRNFLLDVLR